MLKHSRHPAVHSAIHQRVSGRDPTTPGRKGTGRPSSGRRQRSRMSPGWRGGRGRGRGTCGRRGGWATQCGFGGSHNDAGHHKFWPVIWPYFSEAVLNGKKKVLFSFVFIVFYFILFSVGTVTKKCTAIIHNDVKIRQKKGPKKKIVWHPSTITCLAKRQMLSWNSEEIQTNRGPLMSRRIYSCLPATCPHFSNSCQAGQCKSRPNITTYSVWAHQMACQIPGWRRWQPYGVEIDRTLTWCFCSCRQICPNNCWNPANK